MIAKGYTLENTICNIINTRESDVNSSEPLLNRLNLNIEQTHPTRFGNNGANLDTE